jgi:hypothetical protein
MTDLGIPPLYLPQLSTTKPNEPYITIYANTKSDLKSKKRVIVVVNDQHQDLGIWAYRMIGHDEGIDTGCCIGLAKEIQRRGRAAKLRVSDEEPGLIILNPGQLLYSHKKKCPMNLTSWHDKDKRYAVQECDIIHEEHNRVQGNRTCEEHISFVFEKIVKDPDWVSIDAEIYVICICEGSTITLKYLSDKWSHYSTRIAAVALMSSFNDMARLSEPFKTFLGRRGRAWRVSTAPMHRVLDTPSYKPPVAPQLVEDNWSLETPEQSSPHPRVPPLCPEFSSEEPHYTEVIFIKARDTILDWFEEVAKDPLGYSNPDFQVVPWEEPILEVNVPETSNLPAISEANGLGTETSEALGLEAVRHESLDSMLAAAEKEMKEAEGAADYEFKASSDGEVAEKINVGGTEFDKALWEGAGLLD